MVLIRYSFDSLHINGRVRIKFDQFFVLYFVLFRLSQQFKENQSELAAAAGTIEVDVILLHCTTLKRSSPSSRSKTRKDPLPDWGKTIDISIIG